jgi:hypothetical protein
VRSGREFGGNFRGPGSEAPPRRERWGRSGSGRSRWPWCARCSERARRRWTSSARSTWPATTSPRSSISSSTSTTGRPRRHRLHPPRRRSNPPKPSPNPPRQAKPPPSPDPPLRNLNPRPRPPVRGALVAGGERRDGWAVHLQGQTNRPRRRGHLLLPHRCSRHCRGQEPSRSLRPHFLLLRDHAVLHSEPRGGKIPYSGPVTELDQCSRGGQAPSLLMARAGATVVLTFIFCCLLVATALAQRPVDLPSTVRQP